MPDLLLYPVTITSIEDRATWLEIYAKYLRTDGEIRARTKSYHEFLSCNASANHEPYKGDNGIQFEAITE